MGLTMGPKAPWDGLESYFGIAMVNPQQQSPIFIYPSCMREVKIGEDMIALGQNMGISPLSGCWD